MSQNFGERVRQLREGKGITREGLCGDETELSVRQLARIEAGSSIPTLSRVVYIAKNLGVSVGELTDGENLELSRRYKELKYLLLRTPTYQNGQKLKLQETYFEEIYRDYYEKLPEEEQLIIDALRSKVDTVILNNDDLGKDILEDYFHQVQRKSYFKTNDLLLIDLYLTIAFANQFDESVFDITTYDNLMMVLLQQDTISEDLFIVNNVLLNHFDIMFHFKKVKLLERLIETSNSIMAMTHDYHKMPILKMVEWKYYLLVEDEIQSHTSYQSAIMYCDLVGDSMLQANLQKEWSIDCKKYKMNFL